MSTDFFDTMEAFSAVEEQYFRLIDRQISLKDFEKWVYDSETLEASIDAALYFELISLNYNQPHGDYMLSKILADNILPGKFEERKIHDILDGIIHKNDKAAAYLILCYELHWKGYPYFENLAHIGFDLEVPYQYNVDFWHELNPTQQKEILDTIYPKATQLATDLKKWIQLNRNNIDFCSEKRQFPLWEVLFS
jgi:hypothetical protein